MENVLLLDTNTSSFPIYQYIEKSGFNVFVIGNNPSDFLARASRNFINADYSEISAVQQIIKEKNINFIVPGCNDFSYSIAARLNSEGGYYNIETFDNTDVINNKAKFRALSNKIDLPVPRVFSNDGNFDFRPVIVKPVDAYSGRGVTIVKDSGKKVLLEAIEKAKSFSRSGEIVIEEYVQGQLHSHTTFISNGEILIDFIVEEHGTANQFVVDTTKLIYNFPHSVLAKIRAAITRMAKSLGLVDGLIHTQFILNEESFWFIEITRRCPGDLYSKLIEHSTGFPYAEFYARPFLNQKLSIGNKPLEKKMVMRHTISRKSEGLFDSLKFNCPVHLEEMFLLSLGGDMVKASPFGRIGLIFTKSETEEQFSRLWDLTLKRELYNL